MKDVLLIKKTVTVFVNTLLTGLMIVYYKIYIFINLQAFC